MIEAAKLLSVLCMLAWSSIFFMKNGDDNGNIEKVLQWTTSNAILAVMIPIILFGMFLFDIFF